VLVDLMAEIFKSTGEPSSPDRGNCFLQFVDKLLVPQEALIERLIRAIQVPPVDSLFDKSKIRSSGDTRITQSALAQT